jgi:hypothetical protein
MLHNIKPKELIEAYNATEYKVYSPAITITVGQLNKELDKLLLENNETDWTYITSCNPYSRDCSDEENGNYYESLLQHVSGYKYFEGEGQGIDTTWPAEKSILIIGISESQAIQIGNKYNQNAIVFGKYEQVAELKFLNAFEKVS